MARSTSFLIEVRPGRVRTALMEKGRMVDLIVTDDETPSLVGNIYLGRVEKVLDNLNAAFVDVGLGKSGFLAAVEARPTHVAGGSQERISAYVCEGDRIAVQILRDGIEDKGPKLTTRLALTGRTVILTPGDTAIRISRRIADPDCRERLQHFLDGVAEDEEGFIVRTAAEEAINQDILADIEDLREDYQSIEALRDTGPVPALLHGEPDGVLRALRDLLPETVDVIEIDDIDAYRRAKEYLSRHASGLLDRLVHYRDNTAMFDREDVAEELERALASEVPLASGGSILFSETPALVAIDVNAGGTGGAREQSALKANLEAAPEVARQIRLRNLSGLLVVDFISMKNRDNGAKVLEALKQAVSGDSGQVFVGGFTRFGLVEMTRKRNRPSLAQSLGETCADCQGAGVRLSSRTHAFAVMDKLPAEALKSPAGGLVVQVGPRIAEVLSGPLSKAVTALEERLRVKITLQSTLNLTEGEFQVVPSEKKRREEPGHG